MCFNIRLVGNVKDISKKISEGAGLFQTIFSDKVG